jgi:CheY-like chemotaxis protein
MPKQILLVEDSTTMQKVIEITFAHEDYRITSARDADEALGRLREGRPDIVIADAGLAGKSGYDLCATLKADPGMREVPILLLTGNFSPYDEARGEKAGVDAYVIKPFETQVLLDKVADLLRRRGSTTAVGAPTLVAIPPMPVPQSAAMGAVASGAMGEGRRPTVPPQPPPRVPQPSPQQQVVAPLSPVGAPRPPAPSAVSSVPTAAAADTGAQRSTLMGIPAVNPITTTGVRPPPPPGMLVRQTGNLPAIGGAPPPPTMTAAPAQPQQSAMPSWGRASAVSSVPPSPTLTSPPQATTVYGVASPFAQAAAMMPPAPAPGMERPVVTGIPPTVPQMPRPSLIPRAPIPAAVLQTLERIAARGAEYEAIAKLSMDVIEQIVWEVVPELAEALIRAEVERLVKDREQKV